MSADFLRVRELRRASRLDEFIQEYEKMGVNPNGEKQVSVNEQRLEKHYKQSKELIAKIEVLTRKLHNKMENWQVSHLDSQGAYIAIRKQPNSI